MSIAKLLDHIEERPSNYPLKHLLFVKSGHDIKDLMTPEEYNRLVQIIRRRMTLDAQQRDAYKTAYIRCLNKGHDWHVRSQSAWDAGYDEPVVCWRCGEWDF